MSYTPENQNIDDPGWQIIEGIRDFNEAVHNRVKDRNVGWEEDHLESISQLAADLTILSNRLAKELR